MTREPDRFEAKAKELCLTEWRSIAAALRAEHDEALERAAQWHEERAVAVERALPSVRAAGWFSEADFKYVALRMTADREDAKSIRALKSPAAAPAAEPEPYVQALGEALLRKELKPQPDPLRRLTPEELAKARGISRERFEVALAQGRRDRDAMQDEHDKQRLPGTFKAPPSEPAAQQAGEAGGAAAPCNPRSTRSPATATGVEQRHLPAPAALLPRVLAALEQEASAHDDFDSTYEHAAALALRALAAELRAYIATTKGEGT